MCTFYFHRCYFHTNSVIIPVSYIFQILDRKNTEIDELKTHYRNKGKEHDENCAKLEKKGKWTME